MIKAVRSGGKSLTESKIAEASPARKVHLSVGMLFSRAFEMAEAIESCDSSIPATEEK